MQRSTCSSREELPSGRVPRHISQNRHVIFHALIALKLLVLLMSRLVACSARIVVDRQTHRQTDRQAGRLTDRQTDRQADRQADKQTHRTTTVTLATHARRGLMKSTNSQRLFRRAWHQQQRYTYLVLTKYNGSSITQLMQK